MRNQKAVRARPAKGLLVKSVVGKGVWLLSRHPGGPRSGVSSRVFTGGRLEYVEDEQLKPERTD